MVEINPPDPLPHDQRKWERKFKTTLFLVAQTDLWAYTR